MTSLRRPRDVSEERQQDVGRAHLLELHIRPYDDVLVTSAEDVLKTSVGDAHRTSSGGLQDVTLSSGLKLLLYLSLSLSIYLSLSFSLSLSLSLSLSRFAVKLLLDRHLVFVVYLNLLRLIYSNF